jgi:hypothetical protein
MRNQEEKLINVAQERQHDSSGNSTHPTYAFDRLENEQITGVGELHSQILSYLNTGPVLSEISWLKFVRHDGGHIVFLQVHVSCRSQRVAGQETQGVELKFRNS